MAIRVIPGEEYPTHHMSLTDGVDTLGLVLCNGKGEPDPRGIRQSGFPRQVTRISQSDGGYSDFELPYSPQVQSDFSGGRGLEDFDRDSTRFNDSYRCDTTRGDVICGPKATLSGSVNFGQSVGAGENAEYTPTVTRIASSFVASGNFTVKSVRIRLRTTQRIFLHTLIVDDVAGQPYDYQGKNYPYLYIDPTNGIIDVIVPVLAKALTSGTKYWLRIYSNSFSSGVITFGRDTSETGCDIFGQSGDVWSSVYSNQSLSFILQTTSANNPSLFEYRRSLFVLTSEDDQTAPRLYVNGYHGMADSNSGALSKLIDATQAWTTNALTGKIVQIVAGPGNEEETNWRVISSNTATEITVETDWNITHTTSTEYAILGLDTWSEITGHGLTKPVTSVIVVDDIIYMAQGEATNIRRGRYSAGSWAWADDGTNKATFLALIPDVNGKKKVWLAQAAAAQVNVSEAKAWGTNLALMASWLVCGSTNSKITGIEAYTPGGPLIPYIFKEDGYGSISGTTATLVGVYGEHPLSAQLKNVRSENNGRAHLRYDLFLKFSVLDGVESHFDQRLDDVGPNRDEGLPAGRQGPVYAMIAYAGRFYAAIDGGDSGYSSVLCCTRDNSWHEIYRGGIGSRIRALAIQVIPGSTCDRLWIGEEESIYWLPIAIDPRKQSDYQYFSGAQIITAWIYCGYKDIRKYFHELTIFAENLSGVNQYITAEYQTDNSTTWTPLPSNFNTSPAQTVGIATGNNVTGRRIRFRLTLTTTDTSVSPRIKAIRLDAVVRMKPKKTWNVTYMVRDLQIDLQGQEQSGLTIAGVAADWTPESVQALLDMWADSDQSTAPLTMRHLRTLYDSKYVFVEPASVSPLHQVTRPNGEIALIGTFTLLEA